MKHWFGIGLLCLVLAGCGGSRTVTAEAPRPQFQEPDYDAVTLTELSGYLGYLAGLPPLQRRDECRWLHDFVTEAPSLGGRLHLALALLVTPDCLAERDELRVALELLDQAGNQVYPAELRAFLAYQRLIAQRLFSSHRHEQEWGRKLARLRRHSRQQEQRLQRCQTTLGQCQTKLEALKALEKSLNHQGVP